MILPGIFRSEIPALLFNLLCRKLLSKLAIVKLNGGLGTTMGCSDSLLKSAMVKIFSILLLSKLRYCFL